MGWTFYSKPRDVRSHLDGQLTWMNETGSRRVLDSAIVAAREYYAAVEHLFPDGTREVWCAVFMLQFVPKAYDGMTFGYKDMDETMGPRIARCPERILDLLTPTDSEYAKAWRQRCREYHAARKAKPKLAEGMRLRVLNEHVPTIGGVPVREVKVLAAGRKPRFWVDGYGLPFRWPSWRQYQMEVMA